MQLTEQGLRAMEAAANQYIQNLTPEEKAQLIQEIGMPPTDELTAHVAPGTIEACRNLIRRIVEEES